MEGFAHRWVQTRGLTRAGIVVGRQEPEVMDLLHLNDDSVNGAMPNFFDQQCRQPLGEENDLELHDGQNLRQPEDIIPVRPATKSMRSNMSHISGVSNA